MFMVSFMFRPGENDDDFHRLNDEIQAAAYEADDYVGQESWVSPDGTIRNAVSYWSSMAGLREFADMAAHRAAKSQYGR